MRAVDIGERIRMARERVGRTQVELARAVGISDRTLRSYEKGIGIKIEVLRKIAQVLNVSLDWLTGEVGTVFPESAISLANLITINFYPNVVTSAGYGAINGSEKKALVHVNKVFLELLGIKPAKNLDIIRVVGDSMEPFIKNGEYVIIERTQVARNNEIVIAVVDGEVYVKRLQKDPVRRIVKLTSANPAYLDIELKEEELDKFRIIGVIRAKIRLL